MGENSSEQSQHVLDSPLYDIDLQRNRASYKKDSNEYRIVCVADMDVNSFVPSNNRKNDKWKSYLKYGRLRRDPNTSRYTLEWDDRKEITTKLSAGGRGLELSDLAYFQDSLLSMDDRTGLVFDVMSGDAVPKYILMDGDGIKTKGFKGEWATVKDESVWIGGVGKEWTTSSGTLANYDPMWVKQITPLGQVVHHDWSRIYERMRKASGTSYPGYIWHEAVDWNAAQRRWYFLPRRMSVEPYDEVLDETRASNTMFSFDEHFQHIRQQKIGPLDGKRGFSSFKFFPFREDEFVAIKTEEYRDSIKSFIGVYRLDGTILMPDMEIEDVKYEGVEFLPFD